MKLNQFGRKPFAPADKEELTAIGLKDSTEFADGKALWAYYLSTAFPEVRSASGVLEKLRTLLGTPSSTVKDFLKTNEKLTAASFYLTALQLLQFQVGVDFEAADWEKACHEIGVPLMTGDFMLTETVEKAWYTLLSTHTKKGLSLLDLLASKGFYLEKTFKRPLFFNGKAQAVFDTDKLIREVVYVEAPLDTDEDGQRDLLKVEIIRPKETETGLKVPSLFTASPYNQGTNPEAGARLTHDVNVPLTRKEPTDTSYEAVRFKAQPSGLPPARKSAGATKKAAETFQREKNYALNDYFLARGFAAVYSAGIGTRDSEGIQTCGSKEQTIATTAVIEWLAGNRRAFTNRTDNIEIKAWWSNGLTAMTGRSYLGTLATAAATTGVKGLATIVSEAAISNWYQYYRDNGLVVAPGGFPGEDADVLAEETFSRMHDAGDYLGIKEFFNQKQAEMALAQDRATGNYNRFWDERNYLPDVKNIKADIVLVHGLNDWNVKPRQAAQLWQELAKLPISKKLILHQGQHIYIHNMPSIDFLDMMNLWFSYKLYGLENGAAALIPTVVYQANTEKETWRTLSDWQSENQIRLYLGQGVLKAEKSTGIAMFSDQLDPATFTVYTKDINKWEQDVKQQDSPLADNRYFALTTPFSTDLDLQGEPVLKLKAASSQNLGMLSVQLVDYGKKKRLKPVTSVKELKGLSLGYHWRIDDLREFDFDKETPFKMITKGHINLQNRENPWKTNELKAAEFVELSFKLQPTIYRLLAGHQLGIVITGTDFGMTVRGNQDIQYSIDLTASELVLPVR